VDVYHHQGLGIPTFEGTSGSVNLATSPLNFQHPGILLLYTPRRSVAAAKKSGSTDMAVFYCGEIPECDGSVPASCRSRQGHSA